MFGTVPMMPTTPVPIPAPKQIKVLLLDDSNFDRERIRRLSRKTDLPIVLDEVGNIEEMAQRVRSEKYDVILLDYRLPVGSGLEALNHIKDNPHNRHAAKIMITGAGEVETAVQAMQGGCHDYLNKDNLDVHILRESVTNAMAMSQKLYQDELTIAHQREVITSGLASALQDKAVQASVALLLRSELDSQQKKVSVFETPGSSRELDALFIELNGRDEDDEFVFH